MHNFWNLIFLHYNFFYCWRTYLILKIYFKNILYIYSNIYATTVCSFHVFHTTNNLFIFYWFLNIIHLRLLTEGKNAMTQFYMIHNCIEYSSQNDNKFHFFILHSTMSDEMRFSSQEKFYYFSLQLLRFEIDNRQPSSFSEQVCSHKCMFSGMSTLSTQKNEYIVL